MRSHESSPALERTSHRDQSETLTDMEDPEDEEDESDH